MLNFPPETDAYPRLLGGACVVAEDLDGVDEAELLALELLDEEGLLLVVEVAVERVALAHRHPRVGQPVRVQVLGQLRLGRVPQEDEVALKMGAILLLEIESLMNDGDITDIMSRAVIKFELRIHLFNS